MTELPPLVPEEPAAVSPLVRRVLCANPGMMTGPGTNTYLVGHEEVVCLDPGPDDEAHLDAVAAAGAGRIRWIACTHTHPDHSPGAAGLKERTGAEVLAFADVDGLVCDRHLTDGDVLEPDGHRLRAIHTPGHASNHLCFLLEEEGLLFTGDHVMDGSTVVISPPDGDMATYLDSLRRVLALQPPVERIAPGHGRPIDDPAARIEGYLAHRADREAEVLDVLRTFGATGAGTEALVERIYADVRKELHPVARKSVWAHLRKLRDEGAAATADPDDPDATWTAVVTGR